MRRWPRASRPTRAAGHDIVGHVHQLRPDAEARGPRDPGRRGRRPGRRGPARLRHLRVPRSMLHDAASCAPTSRRVEMAVPYHAPCQLRGHGIGMPALDLMALVPGLEAREVDAVCCGIAGTYGLKVEKYDIAMAVGGPCSARSRESGAELVGLRLRDLPLADRPRPLGSRRPPDRAAAPGLRARLTERRRGRAGDRLPQRPPRGRGGRAGPGDGRRRGADRGGRGPRRP